MGFRKNVLPIERDAVKLCKNLSYGPELSHKDKE